ncbi:hypothetical protein NLI96_g727 [Meripilus lineatus]|uniref:DUF6534 domain-containing protein n=1 Tax=Meripilus lineatus TaxID=2056292 RepID=A0AAD5VHI6_9APHY|nr:hypothetical protein NLI96_g727 [Physisporinus lineatus]
MGEYDLTIGTLLVGIVFNTYLYGLVCFQFLRYYREEFNDPLPIKAMVSVLFFVDTVHSTSLVYMLYVYCVTNYGNPEIFSVALWPYTLTPIATAVAALLTQAFLGYRILRLTGSWILFGIVIAVSVPSAILGIACGTRAWIIKVMSELPKLNGLVTAWLALQSAVDIYITLVLSIVLWRSKTGFRRTDSVLNSLIRGSIQTGLFATIFSLGDLITFLKAPLTNFYGMFAFPIGRIYTNTLLDTLLARNELRQALSGIDISTTKPSSGASSALRWASRRQRTTQTIQLTEVESQPTDIVILESSTHSDPHEHDMAIDQKKSTATV